MAKNVPQQDKKTFQDVSYFSKLNYQAILNLKLSKDRDVWSVATSSFSLEYFIQSFYDTGIYKPNIFIGLLTLLIALIILVVAFFCIKIIPKLYKSLYVGSKNRILNMLNQLKTKRTIKTEKIIYLDGLRGLAAFVVVLYHHFYGFYPKLLYPSEDKMLTQLSGGPLNVFFNANFAVYIFFILSGYILTYKFFKTRDYRIIISSAARRYIRLLFPVLFSVVIAFLLMKFSLFYNKESSAITSCCLSTYYSFNPDFFDAIYQAFAGSFFNGQVSYNIVLWTMTYELFGSFLVFGLAALLNNIKKRYIFYGALIILMLNTVYISFILGMILADVSTSKADYLKYIRNNFFTLLALIIGLFLGSFPNNRILDDTLYENMVLRSPIDSVNFYHTWGAFFIMVAIMNSRILKSFFSTRILSFLGKISFSMYVIHFIIVNSFTSFVFINAVRYTSYNNAFLITFGISVTFILFCSYFIYKYIDLTGIRLSKYIFVKYFKKRK